MNAAVFADVHGRGALCFDLCARWQQHTGEPIDLIMQAGDFGAFPERARLDSATRRDARRERTELGFMYHFVGITPEIDALLAKTDAPLVFVRGNHEDHEWLDRLETASREPIFQVDVYGRVFCLKTGAPYTFEARGDTLRIMGIGRITPRSRRRAATSVDIQPYERRRLKRNEHEPVDILLTPDRAAEPGTNGMTEIRDYLALRRPAYHFHGHVGGPCTIHTDENGVTTTVKLADLHWSRDGSLEVGSFGILRWHGPEDHHFSVVDEPWLAGFNQHTWRYTP
ncbi:MAG: metallophosphoesterase [Anaerolineae bacterium]